MSRSHGYASIFVAFVLGLLALYYVGVYADKPDRVIRVGGEKVYVTVMDDDAERSRGLSGRAGLPADEGMLFVFQEPGQYGFWMKDMRFSIDIVWLSASGKVVYMVENVAPSSYPTVFKPDSDALYVLELPAGQAKVYNIQVGDTVQL